MVHQLVEHSYMTSYYIKLSTASGFLSLLKSGLSLYQTMHTLQVHYHASHPRLFCSFMLIEPNRVLSKHYELSEYPYTWPHDAHKGCHRNNHHCSVTVPSCSPASEWLSHTIVLADYQCVTSAAWPPTRPTPSLPYTSCTSLICLADWISGMFIKVQYSIFPDHVIDFPMLQHPPPLQHNQCLHLPAIVRTFVLLVTYSVGKHNLDLP